MKRFFFVLVLVFITAGMLTGASPLPSTSFELIKGLPATMDIGEQYTVVVQVTSDQEFLQAQALPSFAFPGKGVVAIQGGDRAGRGTTALLEVTFEVKGSTAKMPGGAAPVHVVVGVRYPGGYVAVQDYLFNVTVP